MIVTLRNPIEQAYSHWAMSTGGEMTRCPSPWLLSKRGNAAAKLCHQQEFSPTSTAALQRAAKEALALFGREQVLVLRHEHLRLMPQAPGEDLAASQHSTTSNHLLERHNGDYDNEMPART